MDKRRIKDVLKKPAFWIIAVAVTALAAAAVYLLANLINSNKLSPLRSDAVYRNGLYFVMSEIENGEVTAEISNNFVYYDGKITGNIEVKEHTDFEWDDMPKGREERDAYFRDLQNKYVYTWTDGATEYPIDTINKNYWGSTSQGSTVFQVMYGIDLDESVPAGKEDTLVSIYITSFEEPLQFIIPAEGTAPEYGILYGEFSPSDIIYLSPSVSDDSENFLNAARNVVFNAYDDVFAVCNPADDDVICDATYRLSQSRGIALDDTIKLLNSRSAVPEVDISGYTSKIIYPADRIGDNNDYCAVILMDEETWIGHWSWVEDESDGNQLKCDYIFKVENASD